MNVVASATKPDGPTTQDKATAGQASAKFRLKLKAQLQTKKPSSAVFAAAAATNKAADGAPPPPPVEVKAILESSRLLASTAAAAAAAVVMPPAPPPTTVPAAATAEVKVIRESSRLLTSTATSMRAKLMAKAKASKAAASSSEAPTAASTTFPSSPKFRTDARASTSSRRLSTTSAELQKIAEMHKESKLKTLARHKYKERSVAGITGIQPGKLPLKATTTIAISPVLKLRATKGDRQAYGVQGTHTTQSHINPNPISASGFFSPTHSVTASVVSPSDANSVGSRSAACKQVTAVEPFKFHTLSARKSSASSSSNFNKKPQTPPLAELALRFVQSLKASLPMPNESFSRENRPATTAKSPMFQPRIPTKHVKSTDELEAELMDRFKKNPFKAKAVSAAVMQSSGDLGVPKVETKKLTECKPFHLAVDDRGGCVKEAPTTTTAKTVSNLPMPNQAAMMNTSLNASLNASNANVSATPTRAELTTPFSPQFSTTKRLGKKAVAPPESATKGPNSNASDGAPFGSSVKKAKMFRDENDRTLITPFKLSTDVRGSATKARLEEKSRQEEDEARKLATSFRANPVPNYSSLGAAASATKGRQGHVAKALTEPLSFNFATDSRGEFAKEQLLTRVQAEEDAAKAISMSAVKARPVPKTLYQKDFEVKKEERQPLKAFSPALQTKKQATLREKFEQTAKQRREQEEKKKAGIKATKEQEEDMKFKEMRTKFVSEGGLIPEAKPINTEDKFVCRNAGYVKEITTPISPQLRTSLRSMR